MEKIVVFTGAGVSAESGIKTFRDSGGLWEEHDIMTVASPAGWKADKELVLDFYNKRRKQLLSVEPNPAHKALVRLEEKYEVQIITQNIDDLHERAGSKHVLHLHGELRKARSSKDENLIYPCDGDIQLGDRCELGSQLRPHVVWFGEMVPMLEPAANKVSQADKLIIIGTSMQVYPAASLVGYADPDVPVYYIDPKPSISYELQMRDTLHIRENKASKGVPRLVEELLQ